MASHPPDTWDCGAAVAVLADVTNGRLDGFSELGPTGVMIVDLDSWRSGSPSPAVSLPFGFGWIVVGISTQAWGASGLDCDIVLTTAPEAPRPWVSVDDLAGAVGSLRSRIAAKPQAALTAAQLLRRGGNGPPDDDLLCESLAYATLQGGAELADWLAQRGVPRRRRPGTAQPVIVERIDDRLMVTLNRPEVRNAYDAATRDHLVTALQLVVADPSIREVRLQGEGPTFCSGGDLDEFGTATDPSAAHHIRMARSAGWWLSRCRSRVTASLHGTCVGAGIEIPAFAARVEGTPDTVIRLPEVGMGLVPGAGGTASIPRRIGRHRTAWLAISGVDLSAGTALAWGLLDRVSE